HTTQAANSHGFACIGPRRFPMTPQISFRQLARRGIAAAWHWFARALDGTSAASLGMIAAMGVAMGVASGLAHFYVLGFILATVPTAAAALTSARRAAVAIALTSPLVALGS